MILTRPRPTSQTAFLRSELSTRQVCTGVRPVKSAIRCWLNGNGKFVAEQFTALFAAHYHMQDQPGDPFLRGALAEVDETFVGIALLSSGQAQPNVKQ